MAEVLCTNCGRPNSDHREFCDFCGSPLDGALRVEGSTDSPTENLLDQAPESMDDASRLDSLVPAPDADLPPSRLDDFLDDEPLNGDSRLESLLADDIDEPSQDIHGDPDPLNGGSRLDDYLPVDEPAKEEKEESSWLDDYLTPEEPEDRLHLTTESLYTEQADDSSRLDEYLSPETPLESDQADDSSNLGDYLSPETPLESDQADDSSRLEEYLSPETPQESDQADDTSRLDDFFADDPFKSPEPFPESSPSEAVEEDQYSLEQDPFGEPPAPASELPPADQAPADEPFFSRDDLLSDSTTPKPTKDGPGLLDRVSEPDEPEEITPPESADLEGWDFLEETSPMEPPGEDKSTESSGEGDWDFLNPAPGSEQPDKDEPAGSFDTGEWGFLDSAPTEEKPEEEKPSETIDPGEWDFLDPGPEQPKAETPSESPEAGEWDYLDPPSSDADQEALSPEGAEPETSDDWSFLDPGPTADLLDGEAELEPASEEDGEDAGWLDMLQDPESRQKSAPESGPSSEPQKPQTDWLDKIRRLNQSSDLVDEDSSFPDWLAATGKTAEFTGEGEESSDEVPDWLHLDDDDSLNEFLRKKDLTNEEYKPKVTTDSLDETEVSPDKDGSVPDLSDSQQIKFPSWAEEEKRKAQERKEALASEGTEEDGKLPAEHFQIEEDFFDDLFSEELPGWLTAASSQDIRQTVGEDLAQGELPGWVEAMRPVVESADTSGLDDDEEYIENYGPLAGIPSVLPAEAEIGIDFDQAVQKPLDLLATKNHQEYVDLLKKLIDNENKSKAIHLPAPLQTQRALRWLIAIIMLVSIVGTLIFSRTIDAESLTEAQLQGTGFNALFEEIEGLYDGQPVLIAFDYQPAAAGELHTAAATVVDHLMEQGTYLTFISTQPTGPALAEHFLDATQSHHNYIHTQKYINLGYLPGESAGLVSFMISPKKIIPLAFDGSNAWESPPLISIDRIDDFRMILVITDDPNTAKIWIEQIGTRLEETPLAMVVSAQVEPLIQPYFRTSPQQVSGYVAGIIGSMNYETLSERPNLANKNWLPFNIGIVISVGIVFIGGLANGVLSLFSRRKDKDRGESK